MFDSVSIGQEGRLVVDESVQYGRVIWRAGALFCLRSGRLNFQTVFDWRLATLSNYVKGQVPTTVYTLWGFGIGGRVDNLLGALLFHGCLCVCLL